MDTKNKPSNLNKVRILGIESSCDETAAAVIENGPVRATVRVTFSVSASVKQNLVRHKAGDAKCAFFSLSSLTT